MDSRRQYGWVLFLLGLGSFVMLGIVFYNSTFQLDDSDLIFYSVFSGIGVLALLGGWNLLKE